MRIFTAILCLFLSQAVSAEGPWVCTDGNALYTPTVELVKGNKRVLIVGFIHYGPKEYYQNQTQMMNQWVSESSGPVTILTELYTCRSAVAEAKNDSSLNGRELDFLNKNSSGDKNLVQMVLGDRTQTRDCILDVDGINYRPAYVVERNQRAREDAKKDGGAMHWDIPYPRGPNVTVRSGDIVMDHQTPVSQIIGSLGYRRLKIADNDPEKSWDTFVQVFESYMVDYRNKVAVDKAESALATSEQVILPWGAAHLEGMEELLKQKGFQVIQRGAVRFGAESDPNIPDTYREAVKSYKKEAVPMERICNNSSLSPENDLISSKHLQSSKPAQQ